MSEFQAMKCGSCGTDTARLEALPDPRADDNYLRIDIICTGCGERTMLMLGAPVIQAQEGSGSNGMFCIGWGEKS